MAQDHSTLPASAVSIPGVVDWDYALEAVGGDPDLLKDVANAFLVEAPGLLAALRRTLENGDAKEFRRAAHTIKGSSRYFGARRVAETAYQLEQLGEAAMTGGSLESAPPLIDQLAEQVAELIAPLTAFVQKGT